MGKIKNVLQDLETLIYYTGLNAGRWEQNEYDRLDLMQEWEHIVLNMADEYNIDYDYSNVNFDNEYEVDEFLFEVYTNIKIKLEKILNGNHEDNVVN